MKRSLHQNTAIINLLSDARKNLVRDPQQCGDIVDVMGALISQGLWAYSQPAFFHAVAGIHERITGKKCTDDFLPPHMEKFVTDIKTFYSTMPLETKLSVIDDVINTVKAHIFLK